MESDMNVTIKTYCPYCSTWYDGKEVPTEFGKVTHGCGYEAQVTQIDQRTQISAREIKPITEHVAAPGYVDQSASAKYKAQADAAKFAAEQATSTARAKVVDLAKAVLAVSKDAAVDALIAEQVPETKVEGAVEGEENLG